MKTMHALNNVVLRIRTSQPAATKTSLICCVVFRSVPEHSLFTIFYLLVKIVNFFLSETPYLNCHHAAPNYISWTLWFTRRGSCLHPAPRWVNSTIVFVFNWITEKVLIQSLSVLILSHPLDQRSIVPLNSVYSQNILNFIYSSTKKFFRVVFLPQGYPESVSKDYFSYQLWDTIQVCLLLLEDYKRFMWLA